MAGLSGCLMLTGLAGPARAQTPMSAQDPLPALIAARLARAETSGFSGEGLALLRRVYAGVGNRPLWTRAERPRELLAAVENSREDGLEPADHRLEWLRRIVDEPTTDPALLAERDLLLTDTLATLVRHLAEGRRDPHRHHALWNYSPPPDARGQADRLQRLLESGPLAAAVARQAPQLAEYRQLKAGLARYRRLAEAGGWSGLAPGPTLHPGERSVRVPALRARLQAGGLLDGRAVADPEWFDQALSEALMRFQRMHGLAVDGVAGRATWQALNVGLEERIAQIVINLERLRWLAPDLSGDHLRVDIAGYRALLQVGGQLRWEGRVIVGRPLRQTPVLRDRLRRIVLNPQWVVPPTILRQDVIPAMRRNPAYLHEHRLRIVDARGQTVDPASVDWRQGHVPYRLVQDAGPEGSLGQIKFELENRHSIYLHDTPTRALFQRAQRAFSSGCVRVQDPLELALHLLDDAAYPDIAALQAAIETGSTRSLQQVREMPVLLVYLTAVADEAGEVSFREDVYRHDPALQAALAS